MIFFNLPKPRRFHHEYIYVDERKERLNKLKELVKLESEGERAMEANDRKISFDFHSERNTRQKANRLASAFALFCLISVQAERTFERLRYGYYVSE